MEFFTGSIEATKCGEIIEGKNGEKYLKLGDAFKLHEKSGRYFLNFNYEELTGAAKEKSFGNTHYICVSQTKEEREQKLQRKYIGGGKRWGDNNNYQSTQNQKVKPTSESVAEDDLPF